MKAMKSYWQLISAKIDAMSLRERVMIFAAAAFLLGSLLNALLLDPLLNKQKILSAQVVQQQEQAKALRAQLEGLLQARSDDAHSPLRTRVAELKRQLQEQREYVQGRRDRMVEPSKMSALLEQVLKHNQQLQLVELTTLPVSPLLERTAANDATLPANLLAGQKQIFKHGVRIKLRGGYLDMLRYVTALEKMPVQMIWADASLSVEKYPDAVLTLTLYTLSLDKTWLTI